MLRLTVVLFAATAMVYGGTQIIPKYYGDKVGSRFLERGPTSTQYTAESLTAWVKEQQREATGYACPVLFPLDLLFMAFLASLLAVASIGLAGAIDRLTGVAWLFVLVPSLYLGIDFAEDTMLARFLVSPDTITSDLVNTAQTLTKIKIGTVSGAGVQVVLLGLAALLWHK